MWSRGGTEGSEGERTRVKGSEGGRGGARGPRGSAGVRGAHGRRAGEGTRGARTRHGWVLLGNSPGRPLQAGTFRQAPSGVPLRAGPFGRSLRWVPTKRNRPLRRRAHKVGAAAEGGCPGYPRISCGRTSAASGGRPVLRSRAPCPGLPLAASVPSSPEQCCVRGRRCGHRGSADSASCPRSCLLLRISDDGPSPDSHVGKKGAFRVRVAECDSPRPRPAPACPSGSRGHSHGATADGAEHFPRCSRCLPAPPVRVRPRRSRRGPVRVRRRRGPLPPRRSRRSRGWCGRRA